MQLKECYIWLNGLQFANFLYEKFFKMILCKKKVRGIHRNFQATAKVVSIEIPLNHSIILEKLVNIVFWALDLWENDFRNLIWEKLKIKSTLFHAQSYNYSQTIDPQYNVEVVAPKMQETFIAPLFSRWKIGRGLAPIIVTSPPHTTSEMPKLRVQRLGQMRLPMYIPQILPMIV